MQKLMARMSSRAGVSVMVSFALVAGVLLVPSRSGAQAEAAGTLRPLADPDPTLLEDGLNHFIVEIPVAVDPGTPATGAVDGTGDEGAGSGVVSIDQGLLDSVGARTTRLDFQPDAIYAVLEDGSRVRVDRGAMRAEPGPAVPGPTSDSPTVPLPEAVADLVSSGVVVDAEEVAGGYWSVSTDLDTAAFTDAATRAGIVSVERDEVLVSSSNDPYAPWLWGLENTGEWIFAGVRSVEDVDADGVEARAATEGNGVVVAVIDSGVEATHEDLGPLWRNTAETNCTNGTDDDGNGFVDDCAGWDFYNNDNQPFDRGLDNDHGTHVASTIASLEDNGKGTAGLAPGVTVMNLKALQHGSMYLSSGIAAIYYAVDNGADVINASWGSLPGLANPPASFSAAIDYANSRGVMVIAAAGNDSLNLESSPTWPASFTQPNVITVGAHTADDQPASFSNHGTTSVDLYAPGHYIYAAVGSNAYAAMQGTSMAAPHVAAAVALHLSRNPGSTVTETREAILSSVEPVPALASRSVTGGRLNAARVLGLNPDVGDPLQVMVTGADSLAVSEESTLSATVTVADPAITNGRPVEVRASVLTAIGGETYAVTGLAVAVDGTEALTDDRASVAISDPQPADSAVLAAGLTADISLALPAGTYALAFELVDAEFSDVAYGPAATTFFTIGEPTPEPEPTTTSTTAVSPGGPTPTTTPRGSTGPTPTTAPPGPGVPGPTPTTTPGATSPTTTPGSPPTTAPGSTSPVPPPSAGPVPTPPAPPPTSNPTPTTVVAPTPPTTSPPALPVPDPRPSTPTTTTPPSTSPTTVPSTPPTTTPPVDGTPEPQEPVTNDGMTISFVGPRSGPTAGGTLVTVSGAGFGQNVRVLFGSRAGDIVSRTSSRVLVRTPSSSVGGTVDVTVGDYDGNDVTMPSAFTYVASPATGPTPTTVPTGPTTPTTVAPGTSSTTTPSSTTAPPAPRAGRDRLVTIGSPITRNGRTLVKVTSSPVSAPPSTWAGLSCHAATCRGILSR